MGKVRCIYGKTLEELRRCEAEIQQSLVESLDYAAGEIYVSDLVDRYMSMKRDFGQNTMRAYGTAINHIHQSPFGRKKVNQVKLSHAKEFYISLHDKGLKQNTIVIFYSVLRPAFEMAVDDDMIRKNPSKFQVADIIPNDEQKRQALTHTQQRQYLEFIRDNGRDNYYDDIVILLETGLQISELYGLTLANVDMEHRHICIDHRLCRTADKPYFVKEPKTTSGIRTIPISAYAALTQVIYNRSATKVEMMIDGYSGFLFLDKDGKPKVGRHLQGYMRRIH